jgi:aminoglycoside phosphotransferase (APT) family kinase protein
MPEYAPLPHDEQLEMLTHELGGSIHFLYRVPGGAGGTVDVLRLDDEEKLVLKRYWLPEPDELSPAESEFRALALASEHGIPAPAPVWIDRIGLFPERAVVMSFVEGSVLLDPTDWLDWAEQLAASLAAIHQICPAPSDSALFPSFGHDDAHRSEPETIEALREHPLGMRLWARVLDLRPGLKAEDPVYVHHDFWPGNTLWVGERLVAVVDWEGGAIGDPALDVAYCAFDIRMLGRDRAADHFVATYREISGRPLVNLGYWEMLAMCRPMPDIAVWVPGWQALGFGVSVDDARKRHATLLTAAVEGG